MTELMLDDPDLGHGVGALHPLLAHRRSPRAFDATHELGEGELRLLLTAAQWAPSSMNGQPWTFLVGLRGDAVHSELVQVLRPNNARWAPNASALLVAVARTHHEDGTLAHTATYDLGLAVGQLTVQASALGLVVHQMGGFDHPALRERLGIPNGHRPVVVVAVGRVGDADTLPADLRSRELSPRHRRELADIAFARWGSPLAVSTDDRARGEDEG